MTSGDELKGPLAEHYKLIADVIQAGRDKAAETPVRVMVFGPRPGGGKGYAKRGQIKEELNKLEGVTAFFPEDAAVAKAIVTALHLDPDDPVGVEDAIACGVDSILVLEVSPGPVVRGTHPAWHPSVAFSTLDRMPAKYKREEDSSYSGIMRRDLKKRYFTIDEFKSCAVATQICPQHVRGVQFDKM